MSFSQSQLLRSRFSSKWTESKIDLLQFIGIITNKYFYMVFIANSNVSIFLSNLNNDLIFLLSYCMTIIDDKKEKKKNILLDFSKSNKILQW